MVSKVLSDISNDTDNDSAAAHPLASQSKGRKGFLLVLFCLAQFLDTFSYSAMFSAIPVISSDIGLSNSQSVWINSAYQLTFASLLLVSGRMSDIYNTKYVFLAGAVPLGMFSLGVGFVRNKIALLVLRAFGGVAASLTIPSSLNLIVNMFPDPVAQAKAVSAFGGTGALGNTMGVIVGAIFVSYASWPWIFWLIAIIASLIAATCAILIQNPGKTRRNTTTLENSRSLDIVGVSTLTLAFVLFLYAVTSGSATGWGKASVLAPLILSIFIMVAFFIWEAKIPEHKAALPPRMWRYKNFTVLAVVALIPYAWWSSVYLLYSWLWQEVYGWSAVITAVHLLPIGLFSFPFVVISGIIQQRFPPKLIILAGFTCMLAATALLPFADRPSRYWSFAFPAFMVGTAGTTVVFASTNIAIFAVTPPNVAGTVGAMFNCGLQLGAALFAAAITSIQTSVEDSPTEYKGRAAGFWFLFALVATAGLAILVFFKNNTSAGAQDEGERSRNLEKEDQ